MIRKQLYISEEDERNLKKRAKRLGLTEASIFRNALSIYFRTPEPSAEEWDPLDALIGSLDGGPPDSSINHDHYIYGVAKKQP